jgi:hypothetical protein
MWSRTAQWAAGWCTFAILMAFEGLGWLNWINAHILFPVLAFLPTLLFICFVGILIGIPLYFLWCALSRHADRRAQHQRNLRQLAALKERDPSGELLRQEVANRDQGT